MRIFTGLSLAAALALSTSAANAGGLSPEIIEQPPVVVDEMEPAGSSINGTYVILGVLAALLIAAAVNAEDDDDETPADTDTMTATADQ